MFINALSTHLMDFSCHGDVHGRGEGVVGALGLVDMVVGMDRALGPESSAHDLDGAIGDHLVRVHVALSTRSGLPND
jgi:hypothetical protein